MALHRRGWRGEEVGRGAGEGKQQAMSHIHASRKHTMSRDTPGITAEAIWTRGTAGEGAISRSLPFAPTTVEEPHSSNNPGDLIDGTGAVSPLFAASWKTSRLMASCGFVGHCTGLWRCKNTIVCNSSAVLSYSEYSYTQCSSICTVPSEQRGSIGRVYLP